MQYTIKVGDGGILKNVEIPEGVTVEVTGDSVCIEGCTIWTKRKEKVSE